MKFYFGGATGSTQRRALDARRVTRRLESYAEIKGKSKSSTQDKSTRTVVPVDGLKGKRKQKSKSRPKGLGLS